MKTTIWGKSDYAMLTRARVILGTLYHINTVWSVMKIKKSSHQFKILMIFTGKTLQKRQVFASVSVALEYLLRESCRISYKLRSETIKLYLNTGQC